ncbi:sugar phosphate isomerase/epimerase family protein [Ralstonia solanacearum]|uniref:sugar phosphate isomerase/epimerase family protein n=1 Tax=Ralstonia solanacearum TaxID=305 RepID=UPI001239526A|nr:xylose isomerase [Ralstonia solanacearum]AYB51836.1 xylose isomerase [Ralstonia solanacearum]AYB56390.1 xylose isomerase [Ralstonia solanacearum]
MTTTLPIGINLDGVLVHDGLPTPDMATRFAMVAEAGVFDYVERNPEPGEDLAPFRALCDHHGLPMRVMGGSFIAGHDDDRAARGIAQAVGFGARVFNCQLFARHADGHPLSDAEVAAFYLRLLELGARGGVPCLPCLEVHVDMWSEDVRRVARVAYALEREGVALALTLDVSHLIYKIGNPPELAAAGLADDVASGALVLDPASPRAVFRQWLKRGWVRHAHARSASPNGLPNPWMALAPGVPGRGIQYPFVAPPPGTYHAAWHPERLVPWKAAMHHLLDWRATHPEAPGQVSCEFIPFPDYGGGARYSILDNNIACARWLRQAWTERRADGAPVSQPAFQDMAS